MYHASSLAGVEECAQTIKVQDRNRSDSNHRRFRIRAQSGGHARLPRAVDIVR
jgi:hypothetical protein